MDSQTPREPVQRVRDAEMSATQARLWTTCHVKKMEVLDKALLLLLEREEQLLGTIVDECNTLVTLAEEQALEMADMLDEV